MCQQKPKNNIIMTTQQQQLVSEIKAMNLEVSISKKDWGTSIYTTINDVRVRFSDHETSSFSNRHEIELHIYGFSADWQHILDGVCHKISKNYSYTFELVSKVTTHAEFRYTEHNAKSLKISDIKFTANGEFDKKGRSMGTLTFKKWTVKFIGE